MRLPKFIKEKNETFTKGISVISHRKINNF